MKLFGLEITKAQPQTQKPARTGKPRLLRNYKAAKSNDLTYAWSMTPKSINDTLRSDLQALRARSRDIAKNNDYGRRYLGLLVQNVVGYNGIVLQARSIGGDGQLDQPANDAIEKTWKKWGKRCTVDRSHSWHEVQKLFISTIAEDGEILIRKFKGKGPFNYLLQPLDPELLDVGYFNELRNGNKIRMGIEFDRDGAPVAYHIITTPDAPDGYPFNGKVYTRVSADDVLHEFIREKVGQMRGVPWFATPALRMKMLEGYEDAALVNARYGASKMATIESEPGAVPYTGDDVADTEDDGATLQEIEPGIVEELPAGKKLVAFDPAYPSGEFASFVTQMNRGVGAGLHIAYHTLANDLSGVNYSAGRLGEQENRLTWQMLQKFCIEKLHDVVYEEWLVVQLATGGIKVPSRNNGMRPLRAAMFDKYAEVLWQPMKWPFIDPAKEMTAYEKGINLGVYSRAQVIRDLGRNPEDVIQEIEREKEIYDKLGISTGNGSTETEPAEPDETDEPEQADTEDE